MNKILVLKIVFYIFISSTLFYKLISKENELTGLKLKIPKIEKEIKLLTEENKNLQYQIERFENPTHLMELARSKEFAHLRHPLFKDVLEVQEGVAVRQKVIDNPLP